MTNLKDEYTVAEDINDVRQLLKLVKARPAVKKSGERGTLIAYSELTMMEKRLNHAIEMLVKITDEKIVKRFEGGVDKNDNFVRPLGAPSVDRKGEKLGQWTPADIHLPIGYVIVEQANGTFSLLRGKRLVNFFNTLEAARADAWADEDEHTPPTV